MIQEDQLIRDFRGGVTPASLKCRTGRRRLSSGVSAVFPASALMEGKGPVALALCFLFVLQGDRSYYGMSLRGNLDIREDKVASARKTCGKPKPHKEFRRDKFPGWQRPGLIEARSQLTSCPSSTPNFRGGNASASLKLDN